ncbi:MAG: 50S ribosomal protein L11 methyltransferase [Clostridia bacterium]|nr:50S ribosomal protein L11 methyltransferase [Clostridiales bacterium]MDD7165931.1 50S ribosomal protein L11 methyltransferase [Clostridia bacterium]MDY2901631.1 50S ribosomal protein L11 methyltransferase [Christensenellaceae bacterium]
MKFTELTVSTTTSAQELVADIMWNYTNYGVAISDVLDVVELLNDRKSTWDYVDDAVLRELNSNVTLVKAYIPLDITDETVKKIAADLDELKKNCAENGIETGSLETVKRIVDGDDWIEIWRKHYRPIELGNVLICPAWIERKPKEGQVEIIIDSNMAFGTGEHETTSMVISLMQNYVKNAETVIDVGTGSGILGIAAAKLGAKKVVMTDIDYVAVKSAKHNCEINGVADKCEVDLNNLLDDKNITGDLVLANITADVLLILSDSIPSHVKNGGVLIMSGIIKSRVNEVIDRYSAIDFELVQRKDEGEWIALVMKKKDGAEKK